MDEPHVRPLKCYGFNMNLRLFKLILANRSFYIKCILKLVIERCGDCVWDASYVYLVGGLEGCLSGEDWPPNRLILPFVV